MNNFDDHTETEFSGYPFSRARLRRMNPEAIVMRLETSPLQQSRALPPALQVELSLQQAYDLGTTLLKLVQVMTTPPDATPAQPRTGGQG